MVTVKSLQKAVMFEIEKYNAPTDARTLSRTHVPFTGSPRKHPRDPEQILLIPDPYSSIGPYLEFSRSDITHVEKLANVVNMEGDAVTMARLWVKKGSLALQCTPFQVASL